MNISNHKYKYKLIKLSNNYDDGDNCFLCMNKINYYIKFDCECHNYLHLDCVKNNELLTNCFICKKKIQKKYFLNSDNFNNLKITNGVLNYFNTRYYLDKLTYLLLNNPNSLTLFLNFILSLIITLVFIMPLILCDFIKTIFEKI